MVSETHKKTIAALHLDTTDRDCDTCVYKELRLSEQPCYECASLEIGAHPDKYRPDLLAVYRELKSSGLV